MTNFEIVKRLIGEIKPIGKSETDAERFSNLEEWCSLTEELILEIRKVADNKNRYEASMKRCGEYADLFLKNI